VTYGHFRNMKCNITKKVKVKQTGIYKHQAHTTCSLYIIYVYKKNKYAVKHCNKKYTRQPPKVTAPYIQQL